MPTYDAATVADAALAHKKGMTLQQGRVLRDNPIAMAERAAGAPKILGVPYDFQEFVASGTWTKPSNAESGDKVIVELVGAGGSGGTEDGSGTYWAYGGHGGVGGLFKFDEIDDVAATATITVGAGGAAQTASNAPGQAGGPSSFDDGVYTIAARGGGRGSNGNNSGGTPIDFNVGGFDVTYDHATTTDGGAVVTDIDPFDSGGGNGGSARFGGGSGGSARSDAGSTTHSGGFSMHAGAGGYGIDQGGGNGQAGYFPGGGGGAASDTSDSGAGAGGVVRVWCIKD